MEKEEVLKKLEEEGLGFEAIVDTQNLTEEQLRKARNMYDSVVARRVKNYTNNWSSNWGELGNRMILKNINEIARGEKATFTLGEHGELYPIDWDNTEARTVNCVCSISEDMKGKIVTKKMYVTKLWTRRKILFRGNRWRKRRRSFKYLCWKRWKSRG